MFRAAAAVIGLCVAFVFVLYLAYSGDTVPSPEPSPTSSSTAASGSGAPTRSPAAGELPEILRGVETTRLEIGRGAEFPRDMMLIVETGCAQCDVATTGFARVYGDVSGAIRTDTLFSAEKLGLPPRSIQTAKGVQEAQPYITGFAVAPDASEIVVTVCTRGQCGALGFATAPDAETTLFRSSDGGVTWSQFGALESAARVIGRLARGVVLLSTYSPASAAIEYQVYPAGDRVKPPDYSGQLWGQAVLSNGEIIWRTGEGVLLRTDGSLYLDVGPLPSPPAAIVLGQPLVSADGRSSLVTVTTAHPPAEAVNYLLQVAAGGRVERAFSLGQFVDLGVWASSQGPLLGNVSLRPQDLTTPVPTPFVSYLPAIIDLTFGEIHPIAGPFLEPPLLNGRNHIVAAQRGSFARVVNTGSCLTIRAAPKPDAPVLECAADGVLLRLGVGTADYFGGVYDVSGVTWLSVLAPDGTDGFASTQYLER